VAFVLFVSVVIWRVVKLHALVETYEQSVRITGKLASLSANPPGTADDESRLKVVVIWEVWSAQDISVERLALNLYYDYGRGWWQLWKKRTEAITGIPPDNESTYYRKRCKADRPQPNSDNAEFEYVADRYPNDDPHWLLELVVITAIPKTEHRIPIFIDYDEMQSRESNPPQ
jgi:hypothetical protein